MPYGPLLAFHKWGYVNILHHSGKTQVCLTLQQTSISDMRSVINPKMLKCVVTSNRP